jgi:hypothetical protein
MCPVIDNCTSRKIHAVICFLHAKNTSAAEIHHELCTAVYGQNVMSEGTVRHWCRMFMMKSEVVGQPSVVSDDPVRSADHKICENFCENFHISDIRWVPKMLMGAHKMQRWLLL